MGKFTIFTLGCRTNIAESEKLKALLISKKFEYTPNIYESDYIFLNTCTVTHKADRDSKKIFNRIKKINERAKIFITGCAIYLFKEDERIRILNFNDLLKEFDEKDGNINVLPPEESNHARYFLKIQEGCDYRCTFCIVPMRRGKSRSYDISTLVKEVQIAVSKGYKEIVLTGTQ
ncbi:MAG: radical SAM protein, partial [candidate division WOR-3 bacterium]